jgi:thymidylate synthase
MAWKTMVTELLWFLRGDTNIKYLVDNDCNIWNGDAYINYLNNSRPDKSDKDFHKTRFLISKEEFINKIKTDDEFAKKFGELGPIYGKQWRNWVRKTTRDEKIVEPGVYETSIDQIANLINDLKTNPDSRRLMVNAWNVGELDQMVLPPCHYGFQVYTRELTWEEQVQWVMKNTDVEMENLYIVEEIAKPSTPKRVISLMWNQRSVDTFLGLPFNIASYGLLLEIIAKAVNMVPDELIGNLGDVHLYSNHIEQAKEQIGRKYNHEERHELLKKAMGDFYQTAVDEQVPFGGGLSEYYDSYKIPHHSREPYKLPKLIFGKTDEFWKSLSEDISLFGHLDTLDFTVQDYQSHPTIKAPLSN